MVILIIANMLSFKSVKCFIEIKNNRPMIQNNNKDAQEYTEYTTR